MLSIKSLDTQQGLAAFIEAAEAAQACPEALTYLRSCADEGLTLRGAITAVHQRLDPRTARSFALWVRVNMKDQLPDEMSVLFTEEALSGDDCDHEVTARLLATSAGVNPKGAELARLNTARKRG